MSVKRRVLEEALVNIDARHNKLVRLVREYLAAREKCIDGEVVDWPENQLAWSAAREALARAVRE